MRGWIGKHDVFGLSQRHEVRPSDPLYGKKMVRELLELPATYCWFEHKGWRVFILDDIQEAPDHGHQAYIDEVQWH